MKSWTRWQQAQSRRLPAAIRPWLVDQGSLTRQLQQFSSEDFAVRVLASRWQRPLPDEALLLGIPLEQHALQREVQLLDGEQPQVYARTVIPVATYRAMRHRFDALGNRPLGEMLFNDPSLSRGPIQVACLRSGQRLYEMAVSELGVRPARLWGRRSCFYLAGKIMLVNEIFLPSAKWSEK